MEKECYFYLGKQYPLEIVHHNTEPLTFDQRFCLLSHYYDKKEPLIKQWYKQQALRYFQQRTHELAEQFGFSYQDIKLSNAKSYWGICRHDNLLRFHWALIKGPREVIDYVIIHELSHTKVKNHSRAFWQVVADCCPNYKRYEKQLREWQYGH